MHRATERARRSEGRRHIPTDGFISSDAGSYSGSSSEIGSVRTASSAANGEDDEDETLRRAFKESLRLEKDRQRQRREAEREAMLREEEVRRQSLREAQAEARRAQRAAQAEEEAIRTAMEASEREQEEARARRIRENLWLFEQTVEQSRREYAAGNGRGSQRNYQREAQAARPRTHRMRDAMRNAVTRSRAFSFGRSSPEWQDSEGAVSPYTALSRSNATGPPNTTRAPNPTRPSNPTRSANQVGLPVPGGPAPSPRSRSPAPPAGSGERRRTAAPRHYSMLLVTPIDTTNNHVRDVLRRSRREFQARAAAAQAAHDFDNDMQRAINESAEQHRDEEEEAVQRSRGIPTYEEACASVRYRAPPGMRYSFQGPEVIEIPRENGPPTKLSIVGDMDLGEAMRIANQRVKRKRGQTQLN
ncbi:uncharacterized protein TERG_06474 [Trichophyton rubrum CBS 118892]|uniref:Uncharacterized protein n=1 Tax=Trichophyton rubrum (strain ATCC MYA-4607 / CBS 118892) TaxID=559305 RepID=F2SU08_TRIRC|nr:uncharacterized protein TERG_06474 [Trichophyton rubrum CBS 118892]EGD90247.2 hypothetical protein TERG_06474 [Trichophyton rubrum CBS 118892]